MNIGNFHLRTDQLRARFISISMWPIALITIYAIFICCFHREASQTRSIVVS